MKTAVVIIGLLILAAVAIIYRNRTEKYEVIYSTLLSVTNANITMPTGAICYSNNELRDTLSNRSIPELSKMFSFDLDSAELFACIIKNHTIERVVGRGQLGFITLSTNVVEGTCFAVVKGKKNRLFQFNYP